MRKTSSHAHKSELAKGSSWDEREKGKRFHTHFQDAFLVKKNGGVLFWGISKSESRGISVNNKHRIFRRIWKKHMRALCCFRYVCILRQTQTLRERERDGERELVFIWTLSLPMTIDDPFSSSQTAALFNYPWILGRLPEAVCYRFYYCYDS